MRRYVRLIWQINRRRPDYYMIGDSVCLYIVRRYDDIESNETVFHIHARIVYSLRDASRIFLFLVTPTEAESNDDKQCRIE